MLLIVGLGNHEEKYTDTRHNIGFMVVDKVFQSLTPVGKTFAENKDFKAAIAKLHFKNQDILLLKPLTLMNNSGWAVVKASSFYKIVPQNIWVIHDDIDLPLGKLRIRKGGASGGHHGIESIMEKLATDQFMRFRLGVGKGMLDTHHPESKNLHRREVERRVLSPFAEHEVGDVRKMLDKTTKAIRYGLIHGLDKAMNRYN